ncbi:hypothetical protein BD414DRAFT_239956 [Trametes punicea]|nr:hypothetical protein BD414DRAFT_239956 [Trametes punicea]
MPLDRGRRMVETRLRQGVPSSHPVTECMRNACTYAFEPRGNRAEMSWETEHGPCCRNIQALLLPRYFGASEMAGTWLFTERPLDVAPSLPPVVPAVVVFVLVLRFRHHSTNLGLEVHRSGEDEHIYGDHDKDAYLQMEPGALRRRGGGSCRLGLTLTQRTGPSSRSISEPRRRCSFICNCDRSLSSRS